MLFLFVQEGLFNVQLHNSMLSIQDIMDSILHNAEHNIKQNIQHIEDIDDVEDAAEMYYTKFASIIARNISHCENKKELADALNMQMIGNRYVSEVCSSYLDEVIRHIELETDELLGQIMEESTNE